MVNAGTADVGINVLLDWSGEGGQEEEWEYFRRAVYKVQDINKAASAEEDSGVLAELLNSCMNGRATIPQHRAEGCCVLTKQKVFA